MVDPTFSTVFGVCDLHIVVFYDKWQSKGSFLCMNDFCLFNARVIVLEAICPDLCLLKDDKLIEKLIFPPNTATQAKTSGELNNALVSHNPFVLITK